MNNKNIDINITIDNLDDITNEFNNTKLSDELSNYIYNECKGNSLKDNIKINIHTLRELTDDEKEKIVDMIRSNYGIDIKENMLYIKYTNIKGLILFFVGIFLICIYNFLNNFELGLPPKINEYMYKTYCFSKSVKSLILNPIFKLVCFIGKVSFTLVNLVIF